MKAGVCIELTLQSTGNGVFHDLCKQVTLLL